MVTDLPLFAVPVQGTETDERYTPAWLFDELGWFDLDPCSPPAGPFHGHATDWFSVNDDGLAQPWRGRVFMNPPFSETTAWADRFIGHGNGIALLPLANAAWRIRLMAAADLFWFPADFTFVGQNHAQRHVSMPVFLAAIGADNVGALIRLGTSGRHPGVLAQRTNPCL